ncbi:MAG: hypothetical protein RLY86_252 [Pseudomonadota bacterium]
MKSRTGALRPIIGGACAAIALASAIGAAAPALAQDGPVVLEEIIVTATKRIENQQDVPVSVGTVSGQKLEAVFSGGVELLALSGRVPSLYAESTFARTFPRFYIRGLGNNDFDLNSTQPVGVIYDDVVQENPLLRGFPVFDLERVEVLRGPQGTLFGRNTPAGNISFISKKPTQDTDAYFSAAYGRYNAVDVEGAIGGALVENVLSARLSVMYDRRDDFIDNTFTGEDDALGGHAEAAARLQLLYDRGGPFNALLNVHGRDLDGTARLFRANAIQRGTNNVVSGFERNEVFANGRNELDVSSMGGSLKMEYEFGDVLLTSITGYETVDVYTRGDIDGGVAGRGPGFIPFDSETADEIDDHSQWTQEVRLTSTGSGPLRWQTGVFYFNEEVSGLSYAYGNPTDPRGISFYTDADQETTSWAIFGQGNYDLTELLTLTVGARYNDEEKDFAVARFSGTPTPLRGATDVSGDRLTWDVSLSYAATDDINLFTRVASGYRAPSIQSRPLFYFGNNILRDATSIAKAETIMSYEAGFKSDLVDNRVRLNVTAFYSDIDDQQFTAVGGTSNNNTLLNAENGTAYGFEAELEALVTDDLLLTSGLSWNKTEIEDPNLRHPGCGAPCTVTDRRDARGFIIDGNPFPNAPEWMFNVTARYGFEVAGGEMYIFTDWAYRSEVNFFLYESVEFKSDAKLEGGLKLGYVTADDRFEFAVVGRNITNAKELEGAIDFNNLTSFVTEAPYYGVELSARF